MLKKLQFIHTADWHSDADPVKAKKLEASLAEMLKYCKENRIEAIVMAGDIWEKLQSFYQNSGVPLIQQYLVLLAEQVGFIFIVKGNNSHDGEGSVELLHQLRPNIYAVEQLAAYGVTMNNKVIDLLTLHYEVVEERVPLKYIVSMVPYPTKAAFVDTDSIDNQNERFLEKFSGIFELLAFVTRDYSCPKILSFHGNIQGTRLSNGQTLTSQDILVSPVTLEAANHDYYALGHIHLRGFFERYTLAKDREFTVAMGYSGSIYNKSWGETERKSFELVEFGVDENDTAVTMEHQPRYFTNARPMVEISAVFDGEFQIPEEQLEAMHAATNCYNKPEVRFRYKVRENLLPLLTKEKLDQVYQLFGAECKIERTTQPADKSSRSETILTAKSLEAKLHEYANVFSDLVPHPYQAGGTLADSILQKLATIEERAAL